MPLTSGKKSKSHIIKHNYHLVARLGSGCESREIRRQAMNSVSFGAIERDAAALLELELDLVSTKQNEHEIFTRTRSADVVNP